MQTLIRNENREDNVRTKIDSTASKINQEKCACEELCKTTVDENNGIGICCDSSTPLKTQACHPDHSSNNFEPIS